MSTSESDQAGFQGRILIVEDEAALADGVARGLKAEGFEVEVAYDGLTGLERARSAEIDVVVLDIMLPGLNGYRVCRTLPRGGRRNADPHAHGKVR